MADVNGVQRNEELSDDSPIVGMRPGQPHLLQGFQRLLSHLLFQQECCPEKLLDLFPTFPVVVAKNATDHEEIQALY